MKCGVGLLRAAVAASAAALAGAQELPPLAGRVLDAAGSGVAGAEVRVRWRAHPELPGLAGRCLFDRGLREVRARADASGRFRIVPEERGPFLLLAAADGSASAQAFPVAPGDFVELHLEPALAVAGEVRAPDGEPAAGVDVELIPHATSWGRLALYRIPERQGSARSDERGRFTIDWERGYLRSPRWEAFVLPFAATADASTPLGVVLHNADRGAPWPLALARHAPIRFTVSSPDGAPVEKALVSDPCVAGRGGHTDAEGRCALAMPVPARIVVRARGYAAVDLQLRADAGDEVAVRLKKGARLAAVLSDADGAALAAARVLVTLHRRGEPPVEWLAETAADGTFAFDEAPAGGAVTVHAEVGDRFVRVFAGRVDTDLDLGVLRLRQGHRLTGQVSGPDGVPVAQARVVLVDAPPRAEVPPRVTYTDRGGRFAFDAAPEGPQLVLVEGGDRGLGAADVADGQTEVAVAIPPGASIAGRVVDEVTGEPVAGAWVTLTRRGGVDRRECPAIDPGSTALCAIADGEGRFCFRGLPDRERWGLIANAVRGEVRLGAGGAVDPASTDVVIYLRALRD